MTQLTFGGELRRLREQHGLSLKKFAHLVHYDPDYLSKIENGLKPPTATLAARCDSELEADGALSASSERLVGAGCVVVMAEEIHAAKHVHEIHSFSPGVFTSPDTGPIGRVVEGQPRLLARSLAAPTYPTPERRFASVWSPRVSVTTVSCCVACKASMAWSSSVSEWDTSPPRSWFR